MDMPPQKMALNAPKVLRAKDLRDKKVFGRMATQSVILLEKPADIQVNGQILGDQRAIRLFIGLTLRFIRTMP